MTTQTMKTVPNLHPPKEAGEIIHKSDKWLENDRRTGPIIPYVKMGRHVRYRTEDLIAYIEANLVRSADQTRGAI